MLINYENVDIFQEDFQVMKKINFHLDKSEFVYFVGKVGSGKTSVLKTIYAELDIRSGKAEVLGFDMLKLKRKHVPLLRRQLGIVFQDFQLLTDRTVKANLEFVLRSTGWKKRDDIDKRIAEVLKTVDLPDKVDAMPHELSGGEKQRIAIARAILNRPKIILADEPTGNLDIESGRKITSILQEICNSGTAVIMSTHNLQLLLDFPGIVYCCVDGELVDKTDDYNKPFSIEDSEANDNDADIDSAAATMYSEKEEE